MADIAGSGMYGIWCSLCSGGQCLNCKNRRLKKEMREIQDAHAQLVKELSSELAATKAKLEQVTDDLLSILEESCCSCDRYDREDGCPLCMKDWTSYG